MRRPHFAGGFWSGTQVEKAAYDLPLDATRQALHASLFSAPDCSVVLGPLSNTYPYIPMSLLLVMGWTDKGESRTNNYNCRPQDVIEDPRALPVHLSLTPGTPRYF